MIRYSLLAVVLWPVLGLSEVPTPGSEGKTRLKWTSDLDTALAEAGKSRKPVVIDVSTDWAVGSKKMDRETFADGAVQRLLRGCVLVRINPEGSDAERLVAERFGAEDYPTLIVANHKGEAVAFKDGFLEPAECAKFLRGVLQGFKKHGPLGYLPVQLPKDDLLLQAVAQMPAPDTLPTDTASFLLLDQGTVHVTADATAKMVCRMAYYSVDPDRGPLRRVYRTYNSSSDTLRLKTVRILDRHGKGREADVSLAEDEHAYSTQSVYWDVRRVVLDVPPLKAGEILDVVEEWEQRPVMPGHFAFTWHTGGFLIVLGDLTISSPEKLGLQKHPVRCPTPVTETKAADGTVTWRLATKNPLQAEDEYYAPASYETWEGYIFATPTSWDKIGAWFRGLCTGRTTLPSDARARVAELKKQNGDAPDVLQSLFDLVTKDVRYVSVAFGQSSHQPHPVAETWKNRYGDCKDQALLLQALCREAGIESSLLLLGGGYGRQLSSPLPTIDEFDHCILEARCGEKVYHLDPTAGPRPIGDPAYFASGTQALRVGDKDARLVLLPAYRARQDSTFRKSVRLNPNGSATVTDIQDHKGPAAFEAKLEMRQTTPAKMRKYLQDELKMKGQKLLSFSMTDPNEPGDTYHYEATYTLPRFASRSKEGLVFRLGDVSEDGHDWTTVLEAPRARPFRFYPTDVSTQIYEVELPAGAALKSKPDDLAIETPFLRASRKVAVDGVRITLTETSVTLDAKLPASEAEMVAGTFRKLQDNREHAFIVAMPPPQPKEPAK